MEVSGERHARAATHPGKGPPISIEEGTGGGGLRAGLDAMKNCETEIMRVNACSFGWSLASCRCLNMATKGDEGFT
jgi:hypothetical protein